jgi:integrase
MSLAAARDEAKKILRRVGAGEDPGKAKKEARRAQTIAELVDDYIERHAKIRKRSWLKDRKMLDKDFVPALGARRIGEVEYQDIRRAIEKVAQRAPIQANRLFEVVRKLFRWAAAERIIAASPCAGMPKPREESKERERTLSPREIRVFWAATAKELPKIRGAFRLLLILGQRETETLSMAWRQMDQGEFWTIPPEVSKNKEGHRVPLTGPALAVLDELRKGSTSAWVFPRSDADLPSTLSLLRKPLARIRLALWRSEAWLALHADDEEGAVEFAAGDRHMTEDIIERSAMAAAELEGARLLAPPVNLRAHIKKRAEEFAQCLRDGATPATPDGLQPGTKPIVPHDLRRTASTAMGELGVLPTVIERVLNHRQEKLKRTYQRYGYDREKRLALEAWAARLLEITSGKQPQSNVVKLAQA